MYVPECAGRIMSRFYARNSDENAEICLGLRF